MRFFHCLDVAEDEFGCFDKCMYAPIQLFLNTVSHSLIFPIFSKTHL